jgi:Ribosomal protein S8
MALTDPIADMLTILRNASSIRKATVEAKNSVLSENIVKLLKREGFIANYKLMKDDKQGILRIYLKYLKNGTPAILGLKRISRPGLRVYKQADELPKVYSGLGVAIISTSKGLLTDTEARDSKVGGEVICYAW